MFLEVTLKLLSGFGVNCLIFILTLALALPLGLVLAFGSMSRFKPLSKTIKVIIWIVRGTPLMLFLMIVYYGPGLIGLPSIREEMVSVIIAFVINYACYFAEIYRGGIESIKEGQTEAGMVLGMTKKQIFTKVILLQVIKRILPPMGNEIITLVKDTSLARVIFAKEILQVVFGDFVAYGIIWPLFYSAIFYLIFVGVLTIVLGKLEKKLSYFRE